MGDSQEEHMGFDALGPFSSGDLMDGFSPRGGGPMLPIPQHVAVHAGAGGTPGHASCYLPLLTADPLHPPGQLDFAQGGAGYALPLHRMGAHHALRYGVLPAAPGLLAGSSMEGPLPSIVIGRLPSGADELGQAHAYSAIHGLPTDPSRHSPAGSHQAADTTTTVALAPHAPAPVPVLPPAAGALSLQQQQQLLAAHFQQQQLLALKQHLAQQQQLQQLASAHAGAAAAASGGGLQALLKQNPVPSPAQAASASDAATDLGSGPAAELLPAPSAAKPAPKPRQRQRRAAAQAAIAALAGSAAAAAAEAEEEEEEEEEAGDSSGQPDKSGGHEGCMASLLEGDSEAQGGQAPPRAQPAAKRRSSSAAAAGAGEGAAPSRRRRRGEAGEPKPPRSSQYRGVTKHRRSGRYEAHIWVKALGRQVYLGGFEQEEHAAEAYDIAVLKCKGRKAVTNFGSDKYEQLLGSIDQLSVEELVMAVRRQSQGFSRGTSSYRGVTHHPTGRWEARIGVPGSKHVYLGLSASEEEAARAYDRALVRLRGPAASTNFALSEYRSEMADFHLMQQRALTGRQAGPLVGAALERWLKLGALPGGPEEEGEEGGGQAAQHALAPQQEQQEQQKEQPSAKRSRR